MPRSWIVLAGAFLLLPGPAATVPKFEQFRESANLTLASGPAAFLNKTVNSSVASIALSTPVPSAFDDRNDTAGDMWGTSTALGNITISPNTSSLLNTDIKRYAALGDSYAAGVGSGKRVNYRCSRSDLSYPYLLNVDLRGGKHNLKGKDKTFDFTACTGATADDVKKKQLPKLSGKYDLITLTAGGNDINFVNLVNDCVFGWFPKPIRKCYRTMEQAELKMAKVTQNIEELLTVLISKHLAKDGQIYVTGYGKIFNAETEQCDNVNLAFFGAKKPLLRERREKFNRLGDMLNDAIKDAVTRAGPQATFVNYDPYMEMCKGRMCEADAKEPDFKRKATMIYEQGGPTVEVSPSSRLDTIEGMVMRDGISGLIPDKVLRTAHPRPNGHRMIADLILYEMEVQKSEKLGLPPPAKPGREICGTNFAIEEEKDTRESRNKIALAMRKGHTFGYIEDEDYAGILG